MSSLLLYNKGLKLSDDLFIYILLPFLNLKEIINLSSIDKYTFLLVEKYIIKKFGIKSINEFYKIICKSCIRIDFISFIHPSFCSLCFKDNICDYCLNVNKNTTNLNGITMCDSYCKYECSHCNKKEIISPRLNKGKTKFVWFKKHKSLIKRFYYHNETNKDYHYSCECCYEEMNRTDRILYQPNREY